MTIDKSKINSLLRVMFFILIILSVGKSAVAAGGEQLYFKGLDTVAPGGEFVISVLVDAPKSINALDLEIDYKSENLKFLNFNNAGSIVDFWQSAPKLVEPGKIKLTGGIMSGWKGSGGLIIKIYFEALSVGNTSISFEQSGVYLADGRGTQDRAKTVPFSLSVANSAPKATLVQEEAKLQQDNTPPELTLTLVKNPKEHNSLIVFNAVDKESGIKDTQIRFKKWFSYSPWTPAENPVLYPHGAWVIELKTTNNALLESTKTLEMRMKLYIRLIALFLLCISFILLVILLFFRYNKHKLESTI